MPRKYTFIKGIFCLSIFLPIGLSLKCYVCENSINPACGSYFKAYQFDAKHCGPNSKCALQKQPPQDDWVGIVRGCYPRGSLTVNDSNGCRYWTEENGFTALFCFCDTDYCNEGPASFSMPCLVIVMFVIVMTVLKQYIMFE